MALAARNRSRHFDTGGAAAVPPSSAAATNPVTALSFVPAPTATDTTAAAAGTPATPVSYTSSVPSTQPNFGPVLAQTDSFGMPQSTPSAQLPNSAGQMVNMYQPGSYTNPLNTLVPGAASSSVPTPSTSSTSQSAGAPTVAELEAAGDYGTSNGYGLVNGTYVPVYSSGNGQYFSNNQYMGTPYTGGVYQYDASDPNSGVTTISSGSKRGGTIHPRKLAGGGIPTSEAMDPWYTRAEERGMVHPEGLVKSMGAGRTDIHPIQVPAGSYVVPADVVSGLAEGNTMAGSGVIDKMMHTLPFGIQGGGGRHGSGPPRAPNAPAYKEPSDDLNALQQPVKRGGPIKRADGGNAPGYPLPQPKPTYLSPSMFPQPTVDQLAAALPPNVLQPAPAKQKKAEGGGMQQPKQGRGEMVPIVVAGGEHIIYPQTIMKKFGDLKKGHKILDQFVLKSRKKNVEDIRKLKPPKR